MMRCLSPEQIDDLLEGRLEPPDLEASEAHLENCPRCREQFLEFTRIPDQEDWRRAAWQSTPPSDSEAAFLAELKGLVGEPAASRTGLRADGANLIDGESSALRDLPEPPIPRAGRAEHWPTVRGFEILGELGRGGMGVVYKARQVGYDRVVALKMILSGRHASAEDLGRFHDEAEAVSRLRHPHIVQIFEVGQAEGRLYFVLEFVEGGTLAEKIRARALPPRSSAQLLESLARAMHYAHQRGIIHRDLKPANVLLHGRKAFLGFSEDVDRLPEEWDFRRFMPKITDFGLAKLMDRGTGPGHTASGNVVGTPSYMAPEQAQGKPHTIGPTTDVYALGAILYEMLTGRPPFQGETPMDILVQVHTEEPVPPRNLVREVPAALNAICLKCLRKDPETRYQTAEALADDLHLFLQGQPIQTRAMRGYGRGKSGKRSGGWLLAAVVFALAAAVGGIELWRWMHEPERQPVTTAAPAPHEEPVSIARETARLRLRLALADCERGEPARGLFEMATILDDAERDPTIAEFQTTRLNLAAWGATLPELRWISPLLVRAAAFAPGDGELFVVGADRRLMRAGPGDDARPAGLPELGGVQAISVAGNGSTLAAVTADGLRWHDLAGGNRLAHVTTLPNVERPEVSPDGSALLVRSIHDGNAIWLVTRNDAAKQVRIDKLGVPANATAWTWHPKGTHVLVGFADGTVDVKELESSNIAPPRPRQPAPVTGVAWVNDGATTAVACADGYVRFRNLPSSRSVEPPAIHAHIPGQVLIATHANDLVLTAGADRLVKLWRAAGGELLAAVPHPALLRTIAFAADGNGFMTLDTLGTVRMWRVPEAQDVKPVPASSSSGGRLTLFGVEWEPGAKVVRTTDARHQVRRWDVKSGRELDPPLPPPAQSWPVAYTPAGDGCLALGADGVLRLQVGDRYEALLPTSAGEFHGADFSGDGRLLLIARGEEARLFDAATALAIGPALPMPNLQAARFGRDNHQIILSSETESRSWEVPETQLSTGSAWRAWLRRRTGLDRTADGSLRFLAGTDWKSASRP
jgi:serine/threonine protein kinase/WD40 repeat protein